VEETGILKTGTAAVAERYHRGTNQSGMRDYNERLALTLVRRHGSLEKHRQCQQQHASMEL
jgi:hypothetical protein